MSSKPAPDRDPIYYFRDDGCSLHDACLSCPLPRCRYDDQKMVVWERTTRIRDLWGAGLSQRKIAVETGFGWRIVKQALEGAGPRGVAVVGPTARIRELWAGGLSMSKIAVELGINVRVVAQVLNEEESVGRNPSPGPSNNR